MKQDPHIRNLFLDIGAGCTEKVAAKIKGGMDVNCVGYMGFTPLMRAALHGSSPIIQFLLDHGAHPNLKNAQGNTALHCLFALMPSSHPYVSSLDILLKNGADINSINSEGNSALNLAVQACLSHHGKHLNPAPLLLHLIQAGADMRHVNSSGKTISELIARSRLEVRRCGNFVFPEHLVELAIAQASLQNIQANLPDLQHPQPRQAKI